jgi:8-oxo-dGTP diphosphatase
MNVTVDAIVIQPVTHDILLIKRDHEPFKDCFALPGGHMEDDETLVDAVQREIFEETGIRIASPKFIAHFDEPGRDPRGPYVSVLYEAYGTGTPKDSEETREVQWVSQETIVKMDLAFDHNEMLARYFSRTQRLFR